MNSTTGTPRDGGEGRIAQLHAAALYAAHDVQWILDSLAHLATTARAGALPTELAADLRLIADAIDARDRDA